MSLLLRGGAAIQHRWLPSVVALVIAAHVAAPAAAAPAGAAHRTAASAAQGASPAAGPTGPAAIKPAGTPAPARSREPLPVRQPGELRIAVDPTSGAPYFTAGVKGNVGFEADMAVAMARRLSLKPVFVPTAWRDLRSALAEGRADVAINALEVKDDAGVRFTSPYYVASQAILVRAGETRIYELRDLAGKKVATTRGSVAAAILLRIRPKPTSVLADDTESPFKALTKKSADAVLLEAAMVRAWLKKDPKGYRLAGRPVLPRPYGAAVRRSNPRLLSALDQALGAMRKDGEHARILRSYGLWDSLQGVRAPIAPAAGPVPVAPVARPASASTPSPPPRRQRIRKGMRIMTPAPVPYMSARPSARPTARPTSRAILPPRPATPRPATLPPAAPATPPPAAPPTPPAPPAPPADPPAGTP